MTPAVGWFLACLLTPTLLLVLSLGFGLWCHHKDDQTRYSFLTQFPFELFHGEKARNSARIIFFFYSVMDALAGGYLLFTLDKHSHLLALAILYLVAMSLKDLSLAVLIAVPAYEFKPHLLSFVAFSGFSVLSSSLAAVVFVNMTAVSRPLGLTFGIAMVVLGAVSFALLVNPRLGHWTELKSTVDEEGNVDTERPRPFILAFTQWLLIGVAFLSSIVALIGFMLLSI